MNQLQIAKRLAISQATVSRALRNQPGVSAEIRSRVAAVAGRMGGERNLGRESVSLSQGSTTPHGELVGALVHIAEAKVIQPRYLLGLSSAASALKIGRAHV